MKNSKTIDIKNQIDELKEDNEKLEKFFYWLIFLGVDLIIFIAIYAYWYLS